MKTPFAILFSCIVVAGCATQAPTSVLTRREFQAVGWCTGLTEGAGEDPSVLRAIMRREGGAHTAYFDARHAHEDEREARQAMKRARGATRRRLMAQLQGPCQSLRDAAATRTDAPRTAVRYSQTGRPVR